MSFSICVLKIMLIFSLEETFCCFYTAQDEPVITINLWGFFSYGKNEKKLTMNSLFHLQHFCLTQMKMNAVLLKILP